MIITVPQDAALYPTLGPQVCAFIEDNLVFGPGDLRGTPAVLDDEKRGLIYRMYEVYPHDHALAGRRRFRRCALSLPKGAGKTELAAWVSACELHPEGPVRCIGFTPNGEPIGGPVTDPYIPLVAFTAEQSSDLAYAALKAMLEEGHLKDDFDIGLERILRKKGDGKAVSLSSNPSARDGARSTFICCDETHHWTLPRLKLAHQLMLNALGKRKIADPWMLEVTTAPEPGAGSVAEGTMEYAKAVEAGLTADAGLFFFHRQAGDEHDLSTVVGARAAVLEASGAAASWRDIEAIVGLWADPNIDRTLWERLWCNRLVKSATQAFNVEAWRALAQAVSPVQPGDLITLGFDGAMFHDSTGIVATHVASGYQWVVQAWECPFGRTDWQVPVEDVDATIRDCFARYTVWKLYGDPPYWQSWLASWAGQFGADHVIEWWTNRRSAMSRALEGYESAIKGALLHHDGSAVAKRHLGNARRHDLPQRDEDGRVVWLIRKDRPDSPHKIDVTMAAVLSWEARTDAIAAGALGAPVYQALCFTRGGS